MAFFGTITASFFLITSGILTAVFIFLLRMLYAVFIFIICLIRILSCSRSIDSHLLYDKKEL